MGAEAGGGGWGRKLDGMTWGIIVGYGGNVDAEVGASGVRGTRAGEVPWDVVVKHVIAAPACVLSGLSELKCRGEGFKVAQKNAKAFPHPCQLPINNHTAQRAALIRILRRNCRIKGPRRAARCSRT